MEDRKSFFQPVYEVLKGATAEGVCLKYGISKGELDRRFAEYQKYARQMAALDDLPSGKVSRNDPCPCGSGKKYKKCCLPIHEEIKKNLPEDQWQRKRRQAQQKQVLEKEVQRGFGMLADNQFERARKFALRLLKNYPEDDRLHDIVYVASLKSGDYDEAFVIARNRWQVSREEKEYYQERGRHKREEQGHIVNFYSPSTWLEKFWIAQRARHYRDEFPAIKNQKIYNLVKKLEGANDLKQYPTRDEEGYKQRYRALKPVIDELKSYDMMETLPCVLPLTYYFNWASLFVPEIISSFDNGTSIRLLAELSMFRYPYFAQLCLKELEGFGKRAVPIIGDVLKSNKAFDELKVGIILVLGNIPSDESFEILAGLTEHENPYIVNWVAQAMAKHKNPLALKYLEKARERLGELSKIAGAIRELSELES